MAGKTHGILKGSCPASVLLINVDHINPFGWDRKISLVILGTILSSHMLHQVLGYFYTWAAATLKITDSNQFSAEQTKSRVFTYSTLVVICFFFVFFASCFAKHQQKVFSWTTARWRLPDLWGDNFRRSALDDAEILVLHRSRLKKKWWVDTIFSKEFGTKKTCKNLVGDFVLHLFVCAIQGCFRLWTYMELSNDWIPKTWMQKKQCLKATTRHVILFDIVSVFFPGWSSACFPVEKNAKPSTTDWWPSC